jgi:membrane-bound lytic murein transglycosylase F
MALNRPALLALLLLGCGMDAAADETAQQDTRDLARWSRAYDHHFQKYSKHYFGLHFDWTWFKAQAIAESRLDPQARSRSGARGLMQIMPATFGEIRRANPHFDDIRSPKWNIAAGIYYDRQLYTHWKQFHDEHRLYFTFASYNAGLGGIKGVVRKLRKPVTGWHQAAPLAPAQTRHYVSRIRHLKTREVALQSESRGAGGLLARAALQTTAQNDL